MRTTPHLLATATVLAVFETASAHVLLDDPNGLEVLNPGDEFTVQWHVAIQHNTFAWDLEYSTDGGASWKEIALALAPGDITAGAMHSFPWTVPDDPGSLVRVRVKQDNTGQDYYDMSDADLTILPEPAGPAFVAGTLLLAALGSRRSRSRRSGVGVTRRRRGATLAQSCNQTNERRTDWETC